MSFMQEFKEFAMKGSLMDMAAGIIIGAAVSKMVGALVDSVLMPVIGIFMGGVNFSGLAVQVGEASVGYGAFIQALIDFLIVAFVIFIILKFINRLKREVEESEAPPAKPSEDVLLLREIRDILKEGQ